MSDAPTVTFEQEEGVARVTLAAPERGNSLDRELLTRLEEALTDLDPAVRVVLLQGSGARSFSTGYHLQTLLDELDEGASVTDFERHPLERALRALERAPVPTVAVVQGNAYGAGFELALACDLRLASEGARFCLPPARLGILYSATGLRRLVELAGPAAAKELVYTADPVDAAEAHRLGLVNRVVPAGELAAAAAELAGRIARNDPLSLRHHKTLFDRYVRPPGPMAQARREVAALRAECFGSEGFRERTHRLRRRRR